MPKRSTIGKDPLSDARSNFPFAVETNVVELAALAAPKESPAPLRSRGRPQEPRPESISAEDGKACRAVGGRLEIFGGDLGAGASVIWRHGPHERIGFVAPTGRLIDLATELETAQSWQDRTEHRVLSTLGWAWVIGSLGGVIGMVAGGGLRLLLPRRVILQMRLIDGCKMVVRTDSVTESGLRVLARLRAPAMA
ncbi:MAG TPA: hypothetical protein VHY10_05780 [Xanthobacteraceae bacterium]|nr:hypothetical protein [Xanthobacteraceae bacterium]